MRASRGPIYFAVPIAAFVLAHLALAIGSAVLPSAEDLGGFDPDERFYRWSIALALLLAAAAVCVAIWDSREASGKDEEIASTEKIVRNAFEWTSDGIRIIDADYRLVVANKRFLEIWDLPEELGRKGTPLRDILHYRAVRGDFGPGDPDRLADKKLGEVHQEGDVNIKEKRLVTGKIVATRHKRLPGGSWISTYTDITEIRKAETELEEKSAVLRGVLDGMEPAVAAWNKDFELIYWNEKFVKVYRLPPELVHAGLRFENALRHNFTNPDHHRKGVDIDRHINRVVEQIKSLRDDTITGTKKHGDRIYHRSIVRLSDGGFVLTWVDITERRKMEREAKEVADLLKITFDTLAQGVAVYDNHANLVAYNENFRQLFGYPVGFLYPGIRAEELVRYRHARGDYGDETLESALERCRVRHSDPDEFRSDERWLPNGTCFIYHRKPMTSGGFVVSYTDVTEQKRLEEEQRRLEGQLRQSQKMEAIGTLAGGIAHDFNNSLLPIIGLTELAMRELDPDSKAHRNLRHVLEASEHASNLVRQILDFSRVSDPTHETLVLRDVVSDSLGLLRSTVPSTIQIIARMDENVGKVKADKTLLQQVMINLASNAIRAIGAGTGTIEIRLSRRESDAELRRKWPHLPGGPLACMTFRDNGCGMSEATTERVFEPFFTTRPVGEGTGMGLSMVHGIVASHGGAISVSSKEGVGTTFEVFLPLVADARAGEADGQNVSAA